jgi:hypothetical protein
MFDGNSGTAGLAEPAEEYQKKLHSFLMEIPAIGAAGSTANAGPEIKSGTPSFPMPYDKKKLNDHKGTFKTDRLFKKYTGWEHEALLGKWLVDRTTTCNEMISVCVGEMGYKGEEGIGRFDILDRLLGRGLGHAWVHGNSGAQPEYGDVFRLLGDVPDDNGVRLNHMAISLQVIGSDWYTVESGQGGPAKGYDSLRRKKRPWPQPDLQGWVSMRAMLAADKPVPYWLGGWWQVDEDPYDTYWYDFAAGGKVSCCFVKPGSFLSPPVSAPLTGIMTMKGMYGCEIRWQSSDVPEALTLSLQDQKKRRYIMTGRTARGVELTLKKQLQQNPFG